ncbi:dihydrodipicolinate synthase family protein [Cellulosimicrobium sp. NPDC057127]|uniref:dihydrodipicolinate synthase family protein n=1 Tax=Cellulosimicrobium sp. NPDC057127 TaxID=3346026 RepID=UPI003643A303
MSFRGLLAYPITPLTPDGAPDLGALATLVRSAGAAGVDAVTVLATSGAGVTFAPEERDAVVRAAVEAAATSPTGPMPVNVAVSSVSTEAVVRAARAARGAGAAGLVLAPFSYLPLDDAEVVALFAAVADAVDLPVCFYNKPLQTGYDVSPDVLARLAEATRVTAVKDPASLPARPDGRAEELRAALHGLSVDVGLSGDVALLDGAPAADAWHSGLAALAPEEYVTVRRERSTGARTRGGEQARRWLLDVARELAAARPVSGLHALATSLGTPTAPPRGPSLPATPDVAASMRALVARRPVGAPAT